MVLKYVVGAAPTIMEDFEVRIYEAQNDNPGAEVYTEVLPQDGGGGHPDPHVVTANGLDKVVHIVYLFGVTSGFQYERYTAEPREPVVTIFSPIRFKIGDGGLLTPIPGDQIYQNNLLIGLTVDDFVFIRNNVGALLPDVGYTFDSPSGSVQFIGDDSYGEVEEVTIMLQPKAVSTVVNDSVVGKDFGGFVDITVDTPYNNSTHLRKLLRFSGTCKFTFNIVDTVPIGYPFRFQHFGAGAGTGTVEFLNAPLKWTGGNKNSIDIPNLAEGSFVFDGVNWNVVYLSQSNFAGGVAANSIIGSGTLFIGNQAQNTDILRLVTHNFGIVGDYLVFLSCKSTAATADRDDDIQLSWYHHATDKPNKFQLMTGFPSGSATHNATVCFLLIKI